MPNHVYHTISFNTALSSDQKKILKEIEKDERGICGYYMPMPKDLIDTSSPSKILSQEEYDQEMQRIEKENPLLSYKPLTSTMSEELIANYGHNNWYDWANDDNNWGTKWGCYDNEYDDGTYRFTSAWGPVADSILERLTKDIPTFDYSYEEETGWGGEFVMRDGEIISSLHWEEPEFEHVDGDIYYLAKKHINGEGEFKTGYYAFGSLHEFIGDTLEEAAKGI